jgi:hypothetical protein
MRREARDSRSDCSKAHCRAALSGRRRTNLAPSGKRSHDRKRIRRVVFAKTGEVGVGRTFQPGRASRPAHVHCIPRGYFPTLSCQTSPIIDKWAVRRRAALGLDPIRPNRHPACRRHLLHSTSEKTRKPWITYRFSSSTQHCAELMDGENRRHNLTTVWRREQYGLEAICDQHSAFSSERRLSILALDTAT